MSVIGLIVVSFNIVIILLDSYSDFGGSPLCPPDKNSYRLQGIPARTTKIPCGLIHYNNIENSGEPLKKHSPISLRQMLFGLAFLTAFSGMILLLFACRRDEKRFAHITAKLFESEMKSNTLSMHYTVADPERFGIFDYEPVLSCYNSAAALRSQAETENVLAALKSVRPASRIGSLEGRPAFLGYFAGVFCTFSTTTRFLWISESGRANSTLSLTRPPSTDMAFCASATSPGPFSDL